MSERDEFEAWAHERFGYLLPFQRYTDGRYVAAPVSHIWDAWQAARAPHAVPALTEPVAQDECAQDVYEHGQSIGLFDIPKETANAICAGIAAITGARVDWHYIGGRVHMKALAAPQPSPNPKEPR